MWSNPHSMLTVCKALPRRPRNHVRDPHTLCALADTAPVYLPYRHCRDVTLPATQLTGAEPGVGSPIRSHVHLETVRFHLSLCSCHVVAPCCGNVYPCKKCHDAEEDHVLEAQKVQLMVCMSCNLQQLSAGSPVPPVLQTRC